MRLHPDTGLEGLLAANPTSFSSATRWAAAWSPSTRPTGAWREAVGRLLPSGRSGQTAWSASSAAFQPLKGEVPWNDTDAPRDDLRATWNRFMGSLDQPWRPRGRSCPAGGAHPSGRGAHLCQPLTRCQQTAGLLWGGGATTVPNLRRADFGPYEAEPCRAPGRPGIPAVAQRRAVRRPPVRDCNRRAGHGPWRRSLRDCAARAGNGLASWPTGPLYEHALPVRRPQAGLLRLAL